MSAAFNRFHPRLQDAIVARLGWSTLRPVQEHSATALLDGHNAVILAPTAGGKTEASIFPTLSTMLETPVPGTSAIYIAPIKALLNNQAERLGMYTEMVGLDRQVWHGDTPAGEKKRFLRAPCELLMTTPESLEVMLISPRVSAKSIFENLRMVIIDEVHAIAGTDRGAHLMSVLERLNALSKHDLQRAGLSATVGNPQAILDWIQGSSKREGRVVDPPKKSARRDLLVVYRENTRALTEDAARMAKDLKSLFFCQSRATTESVAGQMRAEGIDVFVHHSAVSKEERQMAEENFARGSDACILCTSTLELGIDVGDLDRVLQHEAPDTVSAFMQRMGRTGRRGDRPANTSFFCETPTALLQAIALIELAKSGWVENVDVLDRCWPVFVHQILALCLAGDGATPRDLWQHLQRVPDFSKITKAEFERLIQHMLDGMWLHTASGLLLLGPKTERKFGRKNFMELYAVFSSPQNYTVMAGTKSLGTLQQEFVDRLVEAISTFLLGGRAWSVQHINHKDREIKVVSAPRGAKPRWGGYLPQFLGHRLCQTIAAVLASDTVYAYLHPGAVQALQEQREAYGLGTTAQGTAPWFEYGAHETRWWTFAGGKINATLRYAIESQSGWKVGSDNFGVKIRGDSAKGEALDQVMAKIRSREFWDDDALWAKISGSVPEYRLSKFQDLLPAEFAAEMIGNGLLDRAGSMQFCLAP